MPDRLLQILEALSGILLGIVIFLAVALTVTAICALSVGSPFADTIGPDAVFLWATALTLALVRKAIQCYPR